MSSTFTNGTPLLRHLILDDLAACEKACALADAQWVHALEHAFERDALSLLGHDKNARCHGEENARGWLALRATELRTRLAAMKTNDATHNITRIARMQVAVGREIPIPVASATYAATQAGHLGRIASVAPGRIQPAISLPRRNRDAGKPDFSPARVWIWQQT